LGADVFEEWAGKPVNQRLNPAGAHTLRRQFIWQHHTVDVRRREVSGSLLTLSPRNLSPRKWRAWRRLSQEFIAAKVASWRLGVDTMQLAGTIRRLP
jgi:hypothetical protein